MITPIISIIIISYNTADLTKLCLKSVLADKKLTFDLKKIDRHRLPAEIIVVDNHSTDQSLTILNQFPQINLIKNSANLGFGAANNQAMKLARGNYFLLLNSDTVVLHSAISQSLDWLSSHPDSLACTAQLLNPDKSIQPTGGFFPNLFNVFTLSTGLDDLPLINSVIKPIHPHSPSFYTHDNFYQSDHPQDWITGAFILIRRSAFLATGGFDQKYFMYGEELEWFYRLRLHYPRSTVWYLVGPQIIHLGGASSLNKNYPIIKEIHGIIAFFKLHRPHWQYLFIKFILKINPSLRLRALFFSIFGPQAKANFYRQSCSQI